MNQNTQSKRELVRIGKYLNEVIVIKDATGNLLQKVVKPIMIEFYPRDIVQVVVGATILAVPVSLTEEVWVLASVLPVFNTVAIALFSLLFISIFVYYNYYRRHFKSHWPEFIKRVVSTYIIALLVSLLILYLLGQIYWTLGSSVILTKMVIVALPASMSAAVADIIK
jgi:uncharacterized membrane protein